MCIHNVSVVLILMHTWKSTLHNSYHSYFPNPRFLDPLNTYHYRWQYYNILHTMTYVVKCCMYLVAVVLAQCL